MKKMLTVVLLVFLLIGCNQSDEEVIPESVNARGAISFGLNIQTDDNSRLANGPIPTAILISIEDSEGHLIYNLEKLTLVEVNGSYISSKLELDTGTYTVEDFIVMDVNDTSIYITPKAGSEFESLVSTPLPQEFNVTFEETTTVALEVISSTLGQASDFGYAEFAFNVVVDLEAGLVAHYPFNGNANDESGNELHGTVVGSTLTEDRNGVHNTAYYFDGINDRIEVSNHPLLENQTYSLSVWVRALDETGSFISLSDSNPTRNNCGYYFSIEEQNLRGLSNISSGVWVRNVDDGEITLNEWVHVVFTYDGTTLRLYKNGIETSTLEQPHRVDYSEHNPLQIGTYYRQSGETIYTGALDDIRIYNRALSSSEISVLADQ